MNRQVYYSEKNMRILADGHIKANQEYEEMVSLLMSHKFSNAKADEYAHHGLQRRLKTLIRCIGNIFDLLPPNHPELPSTDRLTDGMIQIQTFIFNLFGSLDNAAWILIHEKKLTLASGDPLPLQQVGFWPDCRVVRRALSPDFRAFLVTLKPWFKILENIRHALAHRISLYIPPFIIDPKNKEKYEALELAKLDAIASRDFEEYQVASRQQGELGFFRPWILHSLDEGSVPLLFHVQMLTDFSTIAEITRRMVAELA
jgi:hypothetical protein